LAGIGGKDNPMAIATVRVGYGFSLGFFCYVLIGGYRIPNLVLMTIFLLLDMIVWTSVGKEMNTLGCHADMVEMYIFCAGTVLALVLAVMDDKLGDRPAGAESLPLNG
jgi:hypothetical protein